jgi:hypothetical protein
VRIAVGGREGDGDYISLVHEGASDPEIFQGNPFVGGLDGGVVPEGFFDRRTPKAPAGGTELRLLDILQQAQYRRRDRWNGA